MPQTQYLFLTQPHRDLIAEIQIQGPIQCANNLPIFIATSPDLGALINSPRRFSVAISCEYDPLNPPRPVSEILHHLYEVAIALQLVKPVDEFADYWLRYDHDNRHAIEYSSNLMLPENLGGPTLQYQQHHATVPNDVRRAIALMPLLSRAMELNHGSWTHPCTSVHRALIFFCHGYSVGLEPLPQTLWAAGLDSIYASKLDRRRQGAPEISRRLQHVFGANFEPYRAPTVQIPGHQNRPPLLLRNIANHIFWLRNASIHGGPIPNPGWLSNPHDPVESGYAYQLLECTEILLRESLLMLLEDQHRFEIFIDAARLDAYF